MKDAPYALTPDMQAVLVRLLATDARVIVRLAPHLKPDRLKDERAAAVAKAALGYYRVHQRAPTLPEVLQEMRLGVEAGQTPAEKFEAATGLLEASYDTPADAMYLVGLVLKAEQDTAMWNALDQGLNKLKVGTPEAYAAIEREVARAAQLGQVAVAPGVDLARDLAITVADWAAGKVIPRYGLGIPDLDEALVGGLAAGELGCILGAAKGGKSATMRQIALYTASRGMTALFITLEMSAAQVLHQNYAALACLPINDLPRHHALVNRRVKEWIGRSNGRVEIRYMTPYATNAKAIRDLVVQLGRDEGLKPDVLLVDYAGRLSASKRSEKRYDEVGYVYSELREAAVSLKIPVWTGHQMNRDGFDEKNPSLANLGESIRPAAECDVLIAVCRTEEEQQAHQVRFAVLASRFCEAPKTVGPFETALANGRIVRDVGGLGHYA